MNTQLMSVLERTHEFGIVMSLGLTPGRLGRLVILETTLMGLGGLAAGRSRRWCDHDLVHAERFQRTRAWTDMAANFNLPSRIYPQVTVAFASYPARPLC